MALAVSVGEQLCQGGERFGFALLALGGDVLAERDVRLCLFDVLTQEFDGRVQCLCFNVVAV